MGDGRWVGKVGGGKRGRDARELEANCGSGTSRRRCVSFFASFFEFLKYKINNSGYSGFGHLYIHVSE